MRNWFREFSTFIVSLFREWAVLLTGGTLAAFFVIWSNVSGRPIPLHAGWFFLSLTLLASAFLSWRKQWREAENNFVQIGPNAPMKLREGKTSPHANSVLGPYIGKRIRITGTFVDIADTVIGMKILQIKCEGVLISGHIAFWTARRFVPLPKGEVITVTGTIIEIDSLSITINGIEIVPNPSVPIVATPLLSEVNHASR
jgi:hypothetical protein